MGNFAVDTPGTTVFLHVLGFFCLKEWNTRPIPCTPSNANYLGIYLSVGMLSLVTGFYYGPCSSLFCYNLQAFSSFMKISAKPVSQKQQFMDENLYPLQQCFTSWGELAMTGTRPQ